MDAKITRMFVPRDKLEQFWTLNDKAKDSMLGQYNLWSYIQSMFPFKDFSKGEWEYKAVNVFTVEIIQSKGREKP